MAYRRLRIPKGKKARASAAIAAALALFALALGGLSLDAPDRSPEADPLSNEALSRTYIAEDGERAAVQSSGIPAVKIDPSERQPHGDGGSSSGIALADSLVVRYLDVGQGDSALISCGGEHLLIDGGPPSASSQLYSTLERLDIDHLDYIVASHADADHCGGISGAITYATCGTCFAPTETSDTKTFATLVRLLGERGSGITVPACGDSFRLGKAEVTFVGPTRSFSDDNDSSLVVRIEYGTTSFLFSGDAETPSERALVSDGANIRCDVLKVAHHGSASSSSTAFLDAADPSYAIVSVGANGYGHPAQATLDELARRNIPVFRTDNDGSVIAKSNGEAIVFDTVKGFVYE